MQVFLKAAGRGDTALVSSFLSAGLCPNEAVQHCVRPGSPCVGWTALHSAAAGGHLETLQTLLAACADVSVRSDAETGMQPLHVAAQHGHERVIFALLLAGADAGSPAPGLDGGSPATPLHLALQQGHWPAAYALLATGAAADAEAVQAAAAAGASVGMLAALLEAGGDAAQEALRLAALAGSAPAGRLLLLYGGAEASGTGAVIAAARVDGGGPQEGVLNCHGGSH